MYDKQKIEKSEKKKTDNWEKEWYCVPAGKDVHNKEEEDIRTKKGRFSYPPVKFPIKHHRYWDASGMHNSIKSDLLTRNKIHNAY